jgi:SnoaL-like protein
MLDYGRRTTEFFSALNGDNLPLIDTFYDQAVEFSDPLGRGSDRLQLHRHYGRIFKHISRMRYEFGPVTAAGGQVSTQWNLFFHHAKLNGGREIALRGATWLEFGGAEDKVIRFHEYFDVGELAYEHLPVLGFIIRKVKKSLMGI